MPHKVLSATGQRPTERDTTMIRFSDDTTNAQNEIDNETPTGKRTLRRTVRGSLNGYVSGKFWCNFGHALDSWVESEAQAWVECRA